MENGFHYVNNAAKDNMPIQNTLYCIALVRILLGMCRSLFRFGVEFYRQLISLSPSDHVNALFSGFYGPVPGENDRLESLKILLKTLKLLQWQSSFEKLMIIAHRRGDELYDRKRPQEVNPFILIHNASLILRMCTHGRRQLPAFDFLAHLLLGLEQKNRREHY